MEFSTLEWTGEGLLIGVRRHGETSVIAEAMVLGKGRYLGLVRGGRSRKQAATLQPGNSVQMVWRARLEDHLGTFSIELLQPRAAELIADRGRLYLSQTLTEHLRLLPERDPHDRLLMETIRLLDSPIDGAALARFEFRLLEELGFGLDLESCAVTGDTEDLTHVSPKTGRAVSREAAEPYKDRLFRLPAFLRTGGKAGGQDVADALAITGHFMDMHIWHPRQIEPPPTRHDLIELLTR